MLSSLSKETIEYLFDFLRSLSEEQNAKLEKLIKSLSKDAGI